MTIAGAADPKLAHAIRLSTDKILNAVDGLMKIVPLEPEQARSHSHRLTELRRLPASIRICLIGASGAGKSSLVSALCVPKIGTPDDWSPLLKVAAEECPSATTTFATEICAVEGSTFEMKVHYVSQASWIKERSRLCHILMDETAQKAHHEAQVSLAMYRQPGEKTLSPERLAQLLDPSFEEPTFSPLLARRDDDPAVNHFDSASQLSAAYAQIVSLGCLIRKVSIRGPVQLPSGITLVDLPGTMDTNPERANAAIQHYRDCDYVFIVANALGTNWTANPTYTEWIQRLARETSLASTCHVISHANTLSDECAPTQKRKAESLKKRTEFVENVRNFYRDCAGAAAVDNNQRESLIKRTNPRIDVMKIFWTFFLGIDAISEAHPHNLGGLREYIQEIARSPAQNAASRLRMTFHMAEALLGQFRATAQSTPIPAAEDAFSQSRLARSEIEAKLTEENTATVASTVAARVLDYSAWPLKRTFVTSFGGVDRASGIDLGLFIANEFLTPLDAVLVKYFNCLYSEMKAYYTLLHGEGDDMNQILAADWHAIESITRAHDVRIRDFTLQSIQFNHCSPRDNGVDALRPTIPFKILSGASAARREIIAWTQEIMAKAQALARDRQIMHAPLPSTAIAAAQPHLAQLQSVVDEAKGLYPECIPLAESVSAARPANADASHKGPAK